MLGDQLSFYVDYQANESFIDSAIEYKNIVKLAKQMGFKMPGAAASVGNCALLCNNTCFVLKRQIRTFLYSPILRRGSILSATNGLTFTLNESVDFSRPENEITVAKVNTFNRGSYPLRYKIILDRSYLDSYIKLTLQLISIRDFSGYH